MNAPVTVITPTIIGREDYLARAVRSVNAQTKRAEAHVIVSHAFDLSKNVRSRIARARNHALEAVNTEWVAFLDDDNWWNANHIEICFPQFKNSDVVYTPTMPFKLDDGTMMQFNTMNIGAYDWEEVLTNQRLNNQIDTNCFVRAEALFAVDCFEESWREGRCGRHGTCRSEDHCLFLSLMERGYEFTYVGIPTWTYETGSPKRASSQLVAEFKSSNERRVRENQRTDRVLKSV